MAEKKTGGLEGIIAGNTTISTAPNFNSLNSASFGQNGLNWGRRSFQFSVKFTF